MVKLLIAVVLGLAVAFGLLLLMQALIATGESALTNVEKTRVIDFVRVQREETIERRRDKPDRPASPNEPPPEAPQPSLSSSVAQGESQGIMETAAAEIAGPDHPRMAMTVSPAFGFAEGAADGDYLPIVKVAPIYPRRAIELGIEGYVILEFTVTKSGSVKDIVVVEAQPSSIFNRAAIEAAEKFKYKPRVVNGEPIEVRGVLHKITFELED